MKIKENLLLIIARLLIRKKNSHHPSFFIISSGRSGTTLLRKLLINSNQVHIPPESNDWLPEIAIIFSKNFYKSWNSKIELCLDKLDKDPSFQFWNIPIPNLRDKLNNIDRKEQNFYGFVDNLYTFGLKRNDLLIGDKTPYLVLELKWLKALFPKAKHIHLIRDGRDVVASRMENFNESVEQATNRWVWAMEETKKHFKLDDNNFMEVKYEDLVTRPEKTLEAISTFLGIHYTDELFDSQKLNLGDTHLKHHRGISKPINLKAIEKWKQKLTDDEIAYIYEKTRYWLNQKGYD